MSGKFAILGILVMAFIARGISAPNSAPKANAADRTEQPQTADRAPATSFKTMADVSFTNGVKSAVYARASFLYRKAQDEGNAIEWLRSHYKATAGDVAFLKSSLGSPTGEADQFSQTVNRSAELSATALAIDWMTTSRPRLDKGAVNLAPILDQYAATKEQGQ